MRIIVTYKTGDTDIINQVHHIDSNSLFIRVYYTEPRGKSDATQMIEISQIYRLDIDVL